MEKKLLRVISIGNIYSSYFSKRKGHFSYNKLCLFQTDISEANNVTE